MFNSEYKQLPPGHRRHYKGEKTHKRLAHGPLEERGCSDCLCLVIFCGFWVGMVFIAAYGFTTGNPRALLAPYNSQGMLIR